MRRHLELIASQYIRKLCCLHVWVKPFGALYRILYFFIYKATFTQFVTLSHFRFSKVSHASRQFSSEQFVKLYLSNFCKSISQRVGENRRKSKPRDFVGPWNLILCATEHDSVIALIFFSIPFVSQERNSRSSVNKARGFKKKLTCT